MKFFKSDGKVDISSDSAEVISLKEALEEIQILPVEQSNEIGFFIGFVNEKDVTIQFVRFGKDEWLIDFPILEDGEYHYSLQDGDLSTNKIKKIIEKFFNGEDWTPLCNLEKNIEVPE